MPVWDPGGPGTAGSQGQSDNVVIPGRGSEMSARYRRFVRSVAVALGVAATVLATAATGTSAARATTVTDPASLVNPIIGTSGAVDTFPGPDRPFGMMQWSPDT